MKRYSMAQARQQLARLLDDAAAGEVVVIERRGVTFQLSAKAKATPKRAYRPRFIMVDPAIAAGSWSWDWDADGVRLVAERRGSYRRRK